MTILSSRNAALAAVVLGMLLIGCGKSHSTQTIAETKPAPPAHFLHIPNMHKRKAGESACTHVRVLAGKKQKVLHIKARCFGVHGDPLVSFRVQRQTSDRPRPYPELLRYRARPVVTTGGRTKQGGRCRLADRELDCEARVHGRSTVVERVWVNPRDRCLDVVAVLRTVGPPCSKQDCARAFAVAQLFRGRPRGCGA